jgi:hypothetical protein
VASELVAAGLTSPDRRRYFFRKTPNFPKMRVSGVAVAPSASPASRWRRSAVGAAQTGQATGACPPHRQRGQFVAQRQARGSKWSRLAERRPSHADRGRLIDLDTERPVFVPFDGVLGSSRDGDGTNACYAAVRHERRVTAKTRRGLGTMRSEPQESRRSEVAAEGRDESVEAVPSASSFPRPQAGGQG